MPSKTISVTTTTFNCGKTFPFLDKARLSQILTSLLEPQPSPTDIIALGFQEIVPIWQGSFPETLETIYIPSLIQEIKRVLHTKFPDDEYELLGHGTVGAVVLVIFYRKTSQVVSTRNLEVCKCTRGFADSSLKGAVKISFELQLSDDTDWQPFHFICCHLNANEGDSYFKARIADCQAVRALIEGTNGGNDNHSSDLYPAHVVILGDLNFSVTKSLGLRLRRQPTSEELMSTLKWDELLGLLREKHPVFDGMKEEPITFPPTYKYKVNRLTNHQYVTLRIPSWCDRILYTDYSKAPSEVTVVAKYVAVPRVESLTFTDHQPVMLLLDVPVLPFVENGSSRGGFNANGVVSSLTTQSELGVTADYVIGYVDWFMYKKYHLWLALLVLLYILYKLL